MSSFYDEVELEDFIFDSSEGIYYYPCPCGDKFQITEDEILDGEEIARCPSCSLMLRVIYKVEDRTLSATTSGSSIVEIVA